MTAFTLRDIEATDSLALARFDDDSAPAAVTSTSLRASGIYHRRSPGPG
jgi:hypothetical protein